MIFLFYLTFALYCNHCYSVHKKACFGRFAHLLFPLSFHLCGTGSGKAGLRAGWLQAAAGGGPKGREPMAGQSHEPSRTAGKCPAPTAPHQVGANPIIHATTLSHTYTHCSPLPSFCPAQSSPVQTSTPTVPHQVTANPITQTTHINTHARCCGPGTNWTSPGHL